MLGLQKTRIGDYMMIVSKQMMNPSGSIEIRISAPWEGTERLMLF